MEFIGYYPITNVLRIVKLLPVFIINIIFLTNFSYGHHLTNNSADIIPVELQVKRVGNIEILVIKKDDMIYLPIVQIFSFLKIKSEYSIDENRVSGFFVTIDNIYEIDINKRFIRLDKSKFEINELDYIIENAEIYLNIDVVNKIFNLDFKYHPRRLIVTLKPEIELPVVTEKKLERRRQRLLSKQLYPEPSLNIGKIRSIFGGSNLNWNITSYSNNWRYDRHRYDFRLGVSILGGDLDARINGRLPRVIRRKARNEDYTVLYRYPFFDNKYLRQITVGDIVTLGVLPRRIFGFEITNRPAERYLVHGIQQMKYELKADEVLEFYSRGNLNSYMRAARDTLIYFQDDLAYGFNDYEFRTYDKWLVKKSQRNRYVIPNKMIPEKEFHYSLSAGRMRKLKNEPYGNIMFNYGATSYITFGAGIEYFKTDRTKQTMYPLTSASVRISNSLVSDFLFSPFAISSAALNYYFTKSGGISLEQQLFARNSYFNPFLAKYSTSIRFDLPLYLNSIVLNLSFNGSQTTYDSRITQNFGSSAGFSTPSINFYVSNYIILGQNNSAISRYRHNVSNITTSFWAPANVMFSAELGYNHILKSINNIRFTANKSITDNLFFHIYTEKYFKPSSTFIGLNISYYLPFLKANLAGIKTSQGYSYSHSFSGSIVSAQYFSDIIFDNRRNYNRGFILFKPFLDKNNNMLFDGNDEELPDIKLKTHLKYGRGFTKNVQKGSLLYNARSYQSYLAYIDQVTIPDPLWVPRYTAISVLAEPNILKVVDYPIVIGGIVQGSVKISSEDGHGVPSITIILEEIPSTGMDKKVGIVKKTQTFSTGEFEFLAVPPGQYRVTLLETELAGAGYVSMINEHLIEVYSQPDGHIIDNIDFGLIKIE